MMDAKLMAMKNSLLGNIFLLFCTAYGFIFIGVLIFFLLLKSRYSKTQWRKKIQSYIKPMFLFGCKCFLSGFFGIYIIGPWLNAWLPSADYNTCGLIGTSFVVFIWLLYVWFKTVRIISAVAMCALSIGILAREYLPNSGKSSVYKSIKSSEGTPVIAAEAQRTSPGSGNIRIFPGNGAVEGVAQSNKTVKAHPLYQIRLLYDQTRAVKSGSIIPIKLELCDANGTDVSARNIVVTATALTQISKNAPGMLVDTKTADPDSNFRYDASLGRSGGYIFNRRTTGLSTGTYSLSFTAGNDPTVHSVQFQVKQQ